MDDIERRHTNTGITGTALDEYAALQIVNHLLAEQRRHDRRGLWPVALTGLAFLLVAIFVFPHVVTLMTEL
ncbi:hypothetical protein [Prescottella agglutinans]|uniref:Uncharacterized protein n=1 Tax=Prescottella agglutinans TaxID=1644129 RepID=A0ABT6MIZ4_9NOCA|nr:hypothetical protein [Prescottella agglutinans]MDH6284293.1 hypothetical protein [Prescottella agglutinans]